MKTVSYFIGKGLDFISGDLIHTFSGDKESSGVSALDALRGLRALGSELSSDSWTVHSFAWRASLDAGCKFNGDVDVKLATGMVMNKMCSSALIDGRADGFAVAEWRPYLESATTKAAGGCASGVGAGDAGCAGEAKVSVLSSSKFSALGDLHEAIHKSINETSAGSCLPVAAYIGVLEMVKADLMSGGDYE